MPELKQDQIFQGFVIQKSYAPDKTSLFSSDFTLYDLNQIKYVNVMGATRLVNSDGSSQRS